MFSSWTACLKEYHDNFDIQTEIKRLIKTNTWTSSNILLISIGEQWAYLQKD